VLAVLLGGCAAGTFEADDPVADAFGPLQSAAWVHDDGSGADRLVLANTPDVCPRIQAFTEARAAFEAALAGGGACADVEGAAVAWADAGTRLYAPGAGFVTVNVSSGGDDTPAVGTYSVGSDPSVSGRLVRYRNAPYATVAESYDPEGPAPTCGLDEDDRTVEADERVLVSGSLTIAAATGAGPVRARFEGGFADLAGVDAGGVRFAFVAAYCLVAPSPP